jgi:hypothetical protein
MSTEQLFTRQSWPVYPYEEFAQDVKSALAGG